MSFYLVILERSAKSLFLVIFKAFRISILGVFVIFRRVQVFDFCISIAQSSQCKNEKSSKEYLMMAEIRVAPREKAELDESWKNFLASGRLGPAKNRLKNIYTGKSQLSHLYIFECNE